MKRLWLMFASLLAATNSIAAPIDITTGITTGAAILSPFQEYKDGTEITSFPVWTFLENKTYGAPNVPPGSSDKNEAFTSVVGNRQLGFASAVSTRAAALEVGVDDTLRSRGTFISFARYYTTYKNNTDQKLNFDFHFVLEPVELTIRGIRDGDTAHLRAGGSIDYVLLSPSGPFGGTYDETTGQLFNDYADIDLADRITGLGLTASFFRNEQTLLSIGTERLSDKVPLPTIPAFGQLTLYYDTFAHMNVLEAEVGDTVKLGDPTDLVGGAGGRFVERGSSAIPWPARVVLVLVGLVFMRGRHAATLRESAYHLDFSGDGWRSPELLREWEQLLHGRYNPDGLYQTPEFFEHLHTCGTEDKKLSLITVRGADGSLAGVVPLRVTRASLSFDVSHRVLGALNLNAVEILGSQPLIPCTSTLHDRLFSTIIGGFPGCHAITMRNVPTDSFLWRHCHESKALRSQFIVYAPYGKRHCHTIPLPVTFEEYLAHFSAKKRYNLRRQVRRLHTHARGAMELRRIEAPDDVTALMDAVSALRRGSLSGSSHAHTGQLSEIDPDAFEALARRDMLLCYILLCEGRPRAAAIGVKYGRTYQMGNPMAAHILKGLDRMIHDESMAAFSPGTVLLFLLIEDLISRGYQLIDMGYGEPAYRHSSTNLVVARGTILLLRRNFSNSVYHIGHAAFRAVVGHTAFRAGMKLVKSLRSAGQFPPRRTAGTGPLGAKSRIRHIKDIGLDSGRTRRGSD